MNFNSIFRKFTGESPMPWWHLLILFVSATEGTVEHPFRFILFFAALLGMMSEDKQVERVVLITYLVSLVCCLGNGFFMAANHFYLIVYFTFFLLAKSMNWVDDRPYANYLLIILMLFAGIQKFLSPFYMEGSYLSFLYLKGKCETVNSWIFSDWSDTVQLFAPFNTLSKGMKPGDSIHFSGSLPVGFELYSQFVSYAIIVLELFFVWAFIYLKPSERGWLMVVFVWLTFLFVREQAFFCLLCIFSLFNCPPEAFNLKGVLKLTVVLLILLKLVIVEPPY